MCSTDPARGNSPIQGHRRGDVSLQRAFRDPALPRSPENPLCIRASGDIQSGGHARGQHLKLRPRPRRWSKRTTGVDAGLSKRPEQEPYANTNRNHDENHETSETEHRLIKPSTAHFPLTSGRSTPYGNSHQEIICGLVSHPRSGHAARSYPVPSSLIAPSVGHGRR